MAAEHTQYSTPEWRELSTEERALLRYLLEREAPHRVREIDDLKIVARCGCGKCPTVMFGRTMTSVPITSKTGGRDVASYRGLNLDGVDVAITLTERQNQLAELEAWAPAGGDIYRWPPLSSLERM